LTPPNSPGQAVAQLKGKLWKKEVTKTQVETYQQQQRVISTRLLAGKTILHIYSDTRPDDGFYPVDPSLEDAYFYHLSA